MFPVLFISFLGFIYAKVKKAEPQVVSDIIIYLSIPALFFSSFYKHKLIIWEIPPVLITISFVMLTTYLLIYFLRKIYRLPLGLYLPSIFMNTAFVGFPVIFLAYGNVGLTRAIAYDFFNGIFIFTFGVYIISGRKGAFELFKLPFLYAAVAGIILNLSGFQLPLSLEKAIEMLGGITIPLALLMLGFRLGQTKIKSFGLPLLSSILRMVLGAGIAWLIVTILKLDPSLGKVLIVMSALPSAFMGLVLGEKYQIDVEFISSSIALCTLLSIIFLPILFVLLK